MTLLSSASAAKAHQSAAFTSRPVPKDCSALPISTCAVRRMPITCGSFSTNSKRCGDLHINQAPHICTRPNDYTAHHAANDSHRHKTCHLPDVIHGLRPAFQQHIRASRAQRLQSLIRQSHDLALTHTHTHTYARTHTKDTPANRHPTVNTSLLAPDPRMQRTNRPVSVLPRWECSCQPSTYRNVVSDVTHSQSATASTAAHRPSCPSASWWRARSPAARSPVWAQIP